MFFHIINQCHSFSFNKSLSIFLFFFCFTCFYIFYFIFNFTILYWFYHISTWIRPFNISCEAILVVVNSSFCFSVVCLVTQLCPTLCNPLDCSLSGFSVHGDSPGKNAEVNCHFLIQGIFPTQRLNPGIPHCKQILYCLSH